MVRDECRRRLVTASRDSTRQQDDSSCQHVQTRVWHHWFNLCTQLQFLLVNLAFKLIPFYPCQFEPHHPSFYKNLPVHSKRKTVLGAHALRHRHVYRVEKHGTWRLILAIIVVIIMYTVLSGSLLTDQKVLQSQIWAFPALWLALSQARGRMQHITVFYSRTTQNATANLASRTVHSCMNS